MKKKIYEALKNDEKFAGLSDQVLKWEAKKLAETIKNEDEIEDALGDLKMSDIVDGYADYRANEAGGNAVKNYEKKHKLKDGKPSKDDGDGNADDDDDPAGKGKGEPKDANAALLAAIESLKAEVASMKSEKSASDRKGKLSEILKDAPEKVKARLEKDFARTTFKDDADFDAWLEESGEYVKEMSEAIGKKGGAPSSPKGGGGGGETASADVKAFADGIGKGTAGASPAIAGLPA